MSQQPTTAIPDFLVDYLAQRDEQRVTETLNMLADLSERELLLVKEAAVMGWVQGIRHADQKIPKDRQVLFTVADACRSFADLYPTITGWTPAADEDVEADR
ncbi:hypothetical protein ACFWNR_06225 [Streptomyces virginiae]|uniref:hypothetical protein n=1 Tax=Streptomyces virginiae TaxID=1961 RepID=UPI003651AC91